MSRGNWKSAVNMQPDLVEVDCKGPKYLTVPEETARAAFRFWKAPHFNHQFIALHPPGTPVFSRDCCAIYDKYTVAFAIIAPSGEAHARLPKRYRVASS